jgi:hypothetical protein
VLQVFFFFLIRSCVTECGLAKKPYRSAMFQFRLFIVSKAHQHNMEYESQLIENYRLQVCVPHLGLVSLAVGSSVMESFSAILSSRPSLEGYWGVARLAVPIISKAKLRAWGSLAATMNARACMEANRNAPSAGPTKVYQSR